VAAGAHIEPIEGVFQQLFRFGVQAAEPADIRWPHLRVQIDLITGKALMLYRPSLHHPFPHALRTLRMAVSPQLFKIHPGHLYLQVHPIQEGTADAAQIFLDLQRGAAAFLVGPIKTTGAGITGRDQREISRVGGSGLGAGHGDYFILQGLTQGFQYVPAEFRKFIHEEHPVLGQADLARTRYAPAADDAGGCSCYILVQGYLAI